MNMNLEKIEEKVLIALKIREGIQNIFRKYNVSTSYCKDDANPFYNQTDENTEGFICEYYYGSPLSIYTPLGKIDIWNGSMLHDKNCDLAIREIEEKFGFVLKREEFNNSDGTYGGWYYITKLPWNNIVLECDCKERNKTEYIGYDEVKELYKQIMNKFKGGIHKC